MMTDWIAFIFLGLALVFMANAAFFFFRAENQMGCICVLAYAPWPFWLLFGVSASLMYSDKPFFRSILCVLWGLIPIAIPLGVLIYARSRRYPVMRKGAIYACLGILYAAVFAGIMMYV